jgi:hypothetical protein
MFRIRNPLQRIHWDCLGVVPVIAQYLVQCLGHCAAHIVAAASPGPIDNPDPQSPLGNSNGVDLLLGYAKFGALIACGVSAVISGGLMAFGSLSNRPDHADRGKRALLWSLAGVAVAAVGIPVSDAIFGAVH